MGFELATDADEAALPQLPKPTGRSCVVCQTIRHGPAVAVSLGRMG